MYRKVEEENENLSQQFQSNIKNRFQDIENDLSVYTHELVQFCMSLKTQIGKRKILVYPKYIAV